MENNRSTSQCWRAMSEGCEGLDIHCVKPTMCSKTGCLAAIANATAVRLCRFLGSKGDDIRAAKAARLRSLLGRKGWLFPACFARRVPLHPSGRLTHHIFGAYHLRLAL